MGLRRPDDRDDEFNTPAEMLTRLGFVTWLASVPSGILLTLAGFFTTRWPLIVGGVALLLAGWVLREWVRRRGGLEATAAKFDNVVEFGGRAEATRLARLVALLREWDALERRRGAPDFDPWAVQAVRNDILAVVEQDPALLSLFRAHRRAA